MFGLFKAKTNIKIINCSGLKQLLSEKKLQLIDVRTQEEFQSGSIASAINIDVSGSNFNRGIEQLDKNALTVVFCRSGMRSKRAANLMQDKGFNNVVNLQGGYLAWQRSE
ncbi:MAG: rhodanese-like domain-containing protein [Flavobacteriaceae bacterium]|nr:rhodanese-like domain-containing protein [Flavobacteriaceae bacterium]